MTKSDTFFAWFRGRQGELGRMKFALLLVRILLFACASIALAMHGHQLFRLILAIYLTIVAIDYASERPKPNWMLAAFFALGVALIWAQVFGLIRVPVINGIRWS